MKKSNIIYASIVGAIILAIILYFSLRHTEGDGHVHTDGEAHIVTGKQIGRAHV